MPNDKRSTMEVLRDSLIIFANTGDGNLSNFPDSDAKRVISKSIEVYEREAGASMSLGFCHSPGSKNTMEGTFSLSDPKLLLFQGSAESMAVALLGTGSPLAEKGGAWNEPPKEEEDGGEEEITEQDIADTMPPPAGE